MAVQYVSACSESWDRKEMEQREKTVGERCVRHRNPIQPPFSFGEGGYTKEQRSRAPALAMIAGRQRHFPAAVRHYRAMTIYCVGWAAYRLTGPLPLGQSEEHGVHVLGTHLTRVAVVKVAPLLAILYLTLVYRKRCTIINHGLLILKPG